MLFIPFRLISGNILKSLDRPLWAQRIFQPFSSLGADGAGLASNGEQLMQNQIVISNAAQIDCLAFKEVPARPKVRQILDKTFEFFTSDILDYNSKHLSWGVCLDYSTLLGQEDRVRTIA